MGVCAYLSKEKLLCRKEGCRVLLQTFPERSEVQHFLNRLEKEEIESLQSTTSHEPQNISSGMPKEERNRF